MKISQVRSSLSFEAARLNLVVSGDNHGNVMSLPQLIAAVDMNKKDIFLNSADLAGKEKIKKDESILNVFANSGDFFINPSKRGFLTKPELSNGDLQAIFFNETINQIKKIAGNKSPFAAVYTLGNHCYDGGDRFILDAMKNAPATTLVTNANLDKSPLLKQYMDESENIVTSKVFEIPDDKRDDLKHHVLFVGVTIPSMKFYNPGLLEGTSYHDDCDKKDAQLKEEDLQGTVTAVRKEVRDFHKKHPLGAVILLSHTGAPISTIIRNNVPGLSVILNGHDHKNMTFKDGGTMVYSLGKDNEIVKSINILFDDAGFHRKHGPWENTFDTSSMSVKEHMDKNGSGIQTMLLESFQKDLEPIVSLSPYAENASEGDDAFISAVKKMINAMMFRRKGNITTHNEVTELPYGDFIRHSNSYLMNYLTSAVKRSVREIYPDIESVAIPSSIVRGGIKDKSNNMDLMKVFDGVSEDLAKVYVGKIIGEDLVGMIVENVRDNLKAPTRNTILQWSDFRVDRTLIEKIINGESDAKFIDAIKYRDPDIKDTTKDAVDIDPDKEYCILLSEKFLVKEDIEYPKKIRDKFVPLGKSYDELFREYIESINYDMKITDKTKESRII